MAEYNLLNTIKKTRRNISERKNLKTKKIIDISRKYGRLYFDGDRKYGYGGYYYDGRWKKVAKNIVKKYKLKKGDKVLDIGCAKGFLVKDLIDIGIDAYGIDISQYAINNSLPETYGRITLCSADNIFFPDKSFDFVMSINTIHNLNKSKCIKAIKEINRLSKKNSFIQVDAYKTEKQKKIFENWVITAKYHDYTKNWIKLFKSCNYKGDWYWTII